MTTIIGDGTIDRSQKNVYKTPRREISTFFTLHDTQKLPLLTDNMPVEAAIAAPGTYARYKNDTAVFLTWLLRTAKECGYRVSCARDDKREKENQISNLRAVRCGANGVHHHNSDRGRHHLPRIRNSGPSADHLHSNDSLPSTSWCCEACGTCHQTSTGLHQLPSKPTPSG